MNKDALTKILNLLRDNNFKQQADELEALASQYYGGAQDDKKVNGDKIKQMCHPKWFGDLFIHGVTQQEWFSLLDRLSKSV